MHSATKARAVLRRPLADLVFLLQPQFYSDMLAEKEIDAVVLGTKFEIPVPCIAGRGPSDGKPPVLCQGPQPQFSVIPLHGEYRTFRCSLHMCRRN